MYRSGVSVKVSQSERSGIYSHFEHMYCTISVSNVSIKRFVIYRPPSKFTGFKAAFLGMIYAFGQFLIISLMFMPADFAEYLCG